MDEARAEARRMLSEFFIKSLNVILSARVPARYLQHQQQQLQTNSFNMVLLNPPLGKCHLSVLEPIVIDVLLLQHDDRNVGCSQQKSSLVERWIVQCVENRKSCPSASSSLASPSSTANAKKAKPPTYRAAHHHDQEKQPWRKVMQMLSLMLRSLYSLTRLLPAYRIFQELNSSSSSSSSGGRFSHGCGFDLSYKVRSTLQASEGCCSSNLNKFSLAPVETELGRMCIVVKYSSWAAVDKAIQSKGSIFADIIPDYVRSPVSNPHRRPTRTKSSNLPLANKESGSCVRRSYSSPLRVKDDDTHEQLVCPFASDDELENCQRMEPICFVRGTSRDAAVGALITSLRQAIPIERRIPKTSLGNALQELKSYSKKSLFRKCTN